MIPDSRKKDSMNLNQKLISGAESEDSNQPQTICFCIKKKRKPEEDSVHSMENVVSSHPEAKPAEET